MNLQKLPTGRIDWAEVAATTQRGTSGTVTTRSRPMGNIQVRLVSYSADYVSDHWYGKGHIVFVVSGAVTIEHKDGRRCEMTAGMSYQVGDDDPSDHRLVSAGGGSIFIVD